MDCSFTFYPPLSHRMNFTGWPFCLQFSNISHVGSTMPFLVSCIDYIFMPLYLSAMMNQSILLIVTFFSPLGSLIMETSIKIRSLLFVARLWSLIWGTFSAWTYLSRLLHMSEMTHMSIQNPYIPRWLLYGLLLYVQESHAPMLLIFSPSQYLRFRPRFLLPWVGSFRSKFTSVWNTSKTTTP